MKTRNRTRAVALVVALVSVTALAQQPTTIDESIAAIQAYQANWLQAHGSYRQFRNNTELTNAGISLAAGVDYKVGDASGPLGVSYTIWLKRTVDNAIFVKAVGTGPNCLNYDWRVWKYLSNGLPENTNYHYRSH